MGFVPYSNIPEKNNLLATLARSGRIYTERFQVSSIFEPAPVPPPLKRAGEWRSIHKTFFTR